MTTGYLWSGQFEELTKVINEGQPQSMELDSSSLQGHWATDNNLGVDFFIINDANFSKLCILGDNVEPCYEGASVTSPEVSKNFSKNTDFQQTLFSMMNDLQTALNSKGGLNMSENELINESAETVEEQTELEPEFTETPADETAEELAPADEEFVETESVDDTDAADEFVDKKEEEEDDSDDKDEEESDEPADDDDEDKKKPANQHSLEELPDGKSPSCKNGPFREKRRDLHPREGQRLVRLRPAAPRAREEARRGTVRRPEDRPGGMHLDGQHLHGHARHARPEREKEERPGRDLERLRAERKTALRPRPEEGLRVRERNVRRR